MEHRNTERILEQALAAAGMHMSARQVRAAAIHLDAVLTATAVQNLTAIRDVDAAVRLHVVDSLLALRELDAAPAGPFCDMGSGAGYPGIPLAIASERPVTLVESTHKKARFLREVARQLAEFCAIDVAETRAELLAADAPATFAAATARAVSSLASLVELASPLLQAGGVLIALKGPLRSEEREAGVSAAARLGMELLGVRDTELPSGEKRSIVTFRRTESLPEIHVPRSPGKAQRKPLA